MKNITVPNAHVRSTVDGVRFRCRRSSRGLPQAIAWLGDMLIRSKAVAAWTVNSGAGRLILGFSVSGRYRRCAPDFFVRRRDGSQVAIFAEKVPAAALRRAKKWALAAGRAGFGRWEIAVVLDLGQAADVLQQAEMSRDREATTSPELALISEASSDDGSQLYTVWYATTRQPLKSDRPNEGFSGKRSDPLRTRYGRCDVSIPKSHRFGELTPAWWRRLRGDRGLSIRMRTSLLADSFWEGLRSTVQHGPDPERVALVFVHGYNVSFDNAILRAAQLGVDLKVAHTAAFSWPSAGRMPSYAADEAAVDAAIESIYRFLLDFVNRSGARIVHLLAHSMGNRALLAALDSIAERAEARGVTFGQLIMAAPDIDRHRFGQLAAKFNKVSRRATLYASEKDKAVGLSKHLHAFDRAGLLPPVTVADGVDTIVATDVDTSFLGHGYFAEAAPLLYDISQLIKDGEEPAMRIRVAANGDHWTIRA